MKEQRTERKETTSFSLSDMFLIVFTHPTVDQLRFSVSYGKADKVLVTGLVS